MGQFSLEGISNNQAPGVYIQLTFAQGQVSLGNTKYACLLMGNVLASSPLGLGSSVGGVGPVCGPDTQITCQSVSDAQYLCGVGSNLSLMYEAFVSVNQVTPVYIMPVNSYTVAG